MDTLFWIIIGLFIFAGFVGFIIKIVVLGWVFKRTIDYWSSFQKEYDAMQSILNQYNASGAGSIPPAVNDQLRVAMWNAQNNLSQMSDLRRERAELMMTDIKSQAASAGLILD